MGATRPHPVRTIRLPAHRLVGVALMVCVIALAGCSAKNRITKPDVQPKYPVLSTPQNVMAALARAYGWRDSVEYALLFDDNYQGTSTDPYLPPGEETLNFTKADEAAHIGALARSRTISYVNVDFGPSPERATDAADSVGWATIQVQYFVLAIQDNVTSYYANSSNVAMEFKFKPTTPAPSSPTDTTWKIIRWSEFAVLR